jgi:hypothetical protein
MSDMFERAKSDTNVRRRRFSTACRALRKGRDFARGIVTSGGRAPEPETIKPNATTMRA